MDLLSFALFLIDSFSCVFTKFDGSPYLIWGGGRFGVFCCTAILSIGYQLFSEHRSPKI